MKNKYRCPKCNKIVIRNNDKKWITSYCEDTGLKTRLILQIKNKNKTMKLNVTQAEILAEEVRKQIEEVSFSKKDGAAEKVVDSFIKEYESLTKEREKAFEICKIIDAKKDAVIKNFNKKTGLNFYSGRTAKKEDFLNNIKQSKIPSVSQIKNKIVMKSLFGSEQEMQAFLQELVKEYSN